MVRLGQARRRQSARLSLGGSRRVPSPFERPRHRHGGEMGDRGDVEPAGRGRRPTSGLLRLVRSGQHRHAARCRTRPPVRGRRAPRARCRRQRCPGTHCGSYGSRAAEIGSASATATSLTLSGEVRAAVVPPRSGRGGPPSSAGSGRGDRFASGRSGRRGPPHVPAVSSRRGGGQIPRAKSSMDPSGSQRFPLSCSPVA
jgi:hypothetical protein